MTRLRILGALVIGIMAGYVAVLAWTAPPTVDPTSVQVPEVAPQRATTSLPPVTSSSPATTTTTALPAPPTYLIWSTGGLPDEFVTGLTQAFPGASIVAGDLVEVPIDDVVLPIDAIAVDPDVHRQFSSGTHLDSLTLGSVLLGETSARLRGVSRGDTLAIGEELFDVMAVVPDEDVAGAEIIFHLDDPTRPHMRNRFARLVAEGARAEVEATIRALYDGPAPLRIRSDGETSWVRHGDAVLPQVFIKEALGEFTYTRDGSDIAPDQTWIDKNIVDTEVPLLGRLRCHKVVVDMLRAALIELESEGLGHLIDPAGFAGCYYPRLIRTVTGTAAGLSRHTWGAAVDINAPTNQLGTEGDQDPRLVEIMRSHGFIWGGDWLVPDPMHFEYGIPPG